MWPCSQILCAVVENPDYFPLGSWKNKRVLELGSGCGLVGLRLAALGAHVVMTDVPQVLELTCRNVQANLAVISSGSVCTEPLTWGQPLSERLVSLKTCEGFDWVVGSDIVYHEHLFDSLASTLRDVCGSKSQVETIWDRCFNISFSFHTGDNNLV